MYEWFWNWRQQSQIDEARRDLNRGERSGNHLRDRVDDLESKLDSMTLYTAALWEVVSARLSISTDELRKKVEEIDLRDGVRDGKITPQPTTCPGCNRTIAARHKRCLYCGADTKR